MIPKPQEGHHRNLLVLSVSGQLAALPTVHIERIAPMAELLVPPGLPGMLAGLLNLRGQTVPVLRLDRMFDLPAQQAGLYSMLVILKGEIGQRAPGPVAIVADRASEVIRVEEDAWLPVGRDNTFNTCIEWAVRIREAAVPVLSPDRLLLEKEKQILADFHRAACRRQSEWEARSGAA
jgi:purine-binding chemotaxis protein CheW